MRTDSFLKRPNFFPLEVRNVSCILIFLLFFFFNLSYGLRKISYSAAPMATVGGTEGRLYTAGV